MRLADDVLPVAREEIPALVIQPQRQVPALIFVGDQFPLKPDDEAFCRTAIAREREGDGLAFGDVSSRGDFDFRHKGRIGCTGEIGKRS